MPHVGLAHGLQQGDGVGHVVAVVGQRLFDRLADQRMRGKVHHGLYRVAGEYPVKHGGIAQVALDKFTARQQFAVAA